MRETAIIAIVTSALLQLAEAVSKSFAYGCAAGALVMVIVLFAASDKDRSAALAKQEGTDAE